MPNEINTSRIYSISKILIILISSGSIPRSFAAGRIQIGKKAEMKIYLDVGTNKTSNSANQDFPRIYLNGSKRIYAKLTEIGFSANDVKLAIEESAAHNENSWSRRFPDVLEWLNLSRCIFCNNCKLMVGILCKRKSRQKKRSLRD